jgi:hypothetical protein
VYLPCILTIPKNTTNFSNSSVTAEQVKPMLDLDDQMSKILFSDVHWESLLAGNFYFDFFVEFGPKCVSHSLEWEFDNLNKLSLVSSEYHIKW